MVVDLKVKLFGAERCHKSQYYKTFLETRKVNYVFLDVEVNEEYAVELRSLYENRKLNFPTITFGDKKLRNPSDEELERWLNKKQLSYK